MKKKRLVACLCVLVLLLAVGLAACSGEEAISNAESNAASVTQSTAESKTESAEESVPAENSDDGALEDARATIEELEQEIAELQETLDSVNAELDALKEASISGGVGQFRYAMTGDTVLVCMGLGKSPYEEDYQSIAMYRLNKGQDTPVKTVFAIPSTSGEGDSTEEELYLQVVDETTAFVAVTGLNNEIMDRELLAVYRTTDGGDTWENTVDGITEIWDSVTQDLDIIHFWDENKGIYCREIDNPEDLTDRVRITTDGGKTWNELWRIVLEEEDPESLSVKSADYKDGVYSISLYRFGNPDVTVATYVSTDLLNWTKG